MKKLLIALLFAPTLAWAQDTPEAQIQHHLDEGKVVIAQWWTDWCTTCQRQKRVIEELRAENDYEDHLAFIEIDHDEWGQDLLAMEQNVVRRSTLVAIGNEGTLDTQVAQTSKTMIKGFLDSAALSAQGKPTLDFGALTPAAPQSANLDTACETC